MSRTFVTSLVVPSPIRRRSYLICAAVLAVIPSTRVLAQSLYWDTNGTGTGAGSTATPTGTWEAANVWSTDPNGTAVASGAWVTGDTAVFSAGTNATGSYTVTLNQSETAAGLTFEEGTVTLAGAGALTLTGTTPSINFGKTGSATAINPNLNVPISAAGMVSFTGLNNITGNLANTPTFGAGVTNTFTGGISIGTHFRLNLQSTGNLGTGADAGTIYFTGTQSAISTPGTPFNNANILVSNNIVINPNSVAGPFEVGFGAAGALPATALTLEFSGNITGGTTANPVTVELTATPFNNNANGQGITVFSGTNTYVGATIVNLSNSGGVFRLGSAAALPVGTSLTFGKGTAGSTGAMDLNGQNISISSLATNFIGAGAVQGISNSNTTAGGNITITGSSNTTFASQIGQLTSANANLSSASNNLSLTLASSHTGSLTLTGSNSFTGDTTLNGGTLVASHTSDTNNTLTGNVIVNSGASLVTAANTANGVHFGGTLTVNTGGTVLIGGSNAVGTLYASNLSANASSDFKFDLGSTGAADTLNLGGGTLSLDAAPHTIDINFVTGSTITAGNYTLMSYGTLAAADPNPADGDLFNLGTTPGGFSFSLQTLANAVVLTVTPLAPAPRWDADGGGGTITEGAGTWADASTNFTNTADGTAWTFHNSDNYDVTIGNDPTQSGGTLSLGSNIRVGGKLIFGPVNSPYTLGDPGTTNTLTLAGGLVAAGTPTINAPVLLAASQTWTATSGALLTLNAPVTESAGGPYTLSVAGAINFASPGNNFSTLAVSSGAILFSSDSNTLSSLSVTGGSTTFSGNSNSIGTLSQSAGTVSLLGSSNSLTSITLTGGTLMLANDSSAGVTAPISIDNNATLNLLNNFNLANPISAGANGATITASSDTTLSGTISGPGSVTKTGAGNLTLAGNNSFLNLTQSAGNLSLVSGAAAGDPTGTLSVADGLTLYFLNDTSLAKNITLPNGTKGHFDLGGHNITMSGAITGTGNIWIENSGTLTLSGASTFSVGALNINGPSTIVAASPTALGNGTIAVNVESTLNVPIPTASSGGIRASSTLHKTGSGTLILTASPSSASAGGALDIQQGAVQMNTYLSVGGTTAQPSLNISIDAGAQLITNFGNSAERPGGYLHLTDATITRPAGITSGDSQFSAYSPTGLDWGGDHMQVFGNSSLINQSVGAAGISNILAFNMPITVNSGATLNLINTNAGGYDSGDVVGLRGASLAVSSTDSLTLQAGSTLITTGPGQARLGRTASQGKIIVAQGSPGSDAVMKLSSNTYMTDILNVDNITAFAINGSGSAGLRIEAPMNASYTDRSIDPDPTHHDGSTGLFGNNNTNTAANQTPTAGFVGIGNAFTVLSPNRAAALSTAFLGNTPSGTLTLAANDAAGATGVINAGPTAATPVALALDNTPTSGNLIYQFDGQGTGAKLLNFAGVTIQRTNTSAGTVLGQLKTNTHLNTLTLLNSTSFDLADHALAVEDTSNTSSYLSAHSLYSSSVNADTNHISTIAIIHGSDLGGSTSFAGITNITSTTTLYAATYYGDINLDGHIDADDYALMDRSVAKHLSPNWLDGDFNNDNAVNSADYMLMDKAFVLSNGGTFAAGFLDQRESQFGDTYVQSLIASVPEPTSLLAACGFALPFLSRRRRAR